MLFFALFLLAILVQFLNYWWIIGPLSFLTAFILGKHAKKAFWYGFIANGLVWLAAILIKIHDSNTTLMSRVSQMFFLPHWSSLIVIAVLIGGLVCGAGAFAGYLTYQLMQKKAKL
ncbi:MAG: hypothetical protein ABIQ88_01340 [Chitinophagaceae bacterium]